MRKNLHGIWIDLQGKLPDQILDNLLAWKKELPKDWRVCLWTNASEIDNRYIRFLIDQGIEVRDVREVVQQVPIFLKSKLEYFLSNPKVERNLAYFSDIFRILLMTLRKDDLFSGIYLDINDTVPAEHSIKTIANYVVPHGLAFRYVKDYFDSNISVFLPNEELSSYPLASKFVKLYFNRLKNYSLQQFISLPSSNKPGITNIMGILSSITDDKTLLFGSTIPTAEVDATKLLALDNEKDMAITYNKEINNSLNDSLVINTVGLISFLDVSLTTSPSVSDIPNYFPSDQAPNSINNKSFFSRRNINNNLMNENIISFLDADKSIIKSVNISETGNIIDINCVDLVHAKKILNKLISMNFTEHENNLRIDIINPTRVEIRFEAVPPFLKLLEDFTHNNTSSAKRKFV